MMQLAIALCLFLGLFVGFLAGVLATCFTELGWTTDVSELQTRFPEDFYDDDIDCLNPS